MHVFSVGSSWLLLFIFSLILFFRCWSSQWDPWLFYTQVEHVGMPGIGLAFLTPDSDNRTCGKLLLLKPCLLDIGHPYDIAASISHFVSETRAAPLYMEHCCHRATGSKTLNGGARVTVGGKLTGLRDRP